MKKYLIFAASALALASCSSDDFLGENPGTAQNATTAINFGGEAGKITRATSNEGSYAKMLDGQFKVYGVKKASNGILVPVFPNYYVWNDAKNTTSNSNGWEYVGKIGDKNLGIGNIELKGSHDQTIKYWDYSASEYHFVAGSPIDAFAFDTPADLTTGTKINKATVSKLAGHIKENGAGTALVADPVYIADPVKKEKANHDYKKTVTFNFQRQQSMVRVGIYETIPGYFVSNVRFYAYNDAGDLKVTTKNNIILTSSSTNDYFVGGENVSGTVKYDWTTPSYTFEYVNDVNLKKSKNWYAGNLGTGKLAETSTATVEHLYGSDKDMAPATGYFTVLPTPASTNASPILIKCDYTLNAQDSGETIEVKGATAAIPAAFSKWEANTRYTYLFKISDNTNGTTGDPTNPDDPAGLFPITFDAVVKEVEQGTTTTVATPSITTYQEGSVEGTTIEYKTDKPIYATVYDQATSELKDLTSDDVQVYKLSTERTEAELQVANIFKAEITNNTPLSITVHTTSTTVNNVTLDANKHLSFKPKAAGYYAIKYKYAADTYKYKVIKVTTTPAP